MSTPSSDKRIGTTVDGHNVKGCKYCGIAGYWRNDGTKEVPKWIFVELDSKKDHDCPKKQGGQGAPRKVYPNESNLYFGLMQILECDLAAANNFLKTNEGWRLIAYVPLGVGDGKERTLIFRYILGRFPN